MRQVGAEGERPLGKGEARLIHLPLLVNVSMEAGIINGHKAERVAGAALADTVRGVVGQIGGEVLRLAAPLPRAG